MKFGSINHIILFGGGKLLAEFILKLKQEKINTIVVTSKRHSKENIYQQNKLCNFEQFLIINNIHYYLSNDVNTDIRIKNQITSKSIGMSFGAAWIFKKEFINLFNNRLLNIHGARLPQNRGSGGFSWQILQKNRLGFALIHKIDQKVDTGPIIMYKEFFYPYSCRIPQEYEEIYIQKSLELLFEFWKNIKKNNNFTLNNQLEYFGTYWPRLTTEIHGFIDWNWQLKHIESFICAFDDPYKGASTFINKRRVFLKSCSIDFNDGIFHPFQTGIIYRKTDTALFVATEQGSLIVEKVNDERKKNYLNKIRTGDRFYTPNKSLDKAIQSRSVYLPNGLRLK